MNIKEKRTAKGLTQEQLAKLVNTDRSTVAKWETGGSLPRADKLPTLATVLDCSVDELLRDAG
jgi:transcriptional regulator with XRE-family HTH domain